MKKLEDRVDKQAFQTKWGIVVAIVTALGSSGLIGNHNNSTAEDMKTKIAVELAILNEWRLSSETRLEEQAREIQKLREALIRTQIEINRDIGINEPEIIHHRPPRVDHQQYYKDLWEPKD